MEQGDQAAQQVRKVDRWAETRVRILSISRLVLIATGFGMSVAMTIVLVLNGLQLLGAHVGALNAFGTMVLLCALMVGGGLYALPRLETRLVAELQRSTDPSLAIAVVATATAFPGRRIRPSLEVEIARLLNLIDRPFWEQNRNKIAQQIGPLLDKARAQSRMNPLDGPVMLALLDAIARCGRTEYLKQVERIEKVRPGQIPEPLAGSAARCAASLRDRKRRDREAATLLRPASATDSLLRPAGNVSVDEAVLLRPSSSDS